MIHHSQPLRSRSQSGKVDGSEWPHWRTVQTERGPARFGGWQLHRDTAWNLFTEWTQADTIFRLISRVTIYPDRAGIEINLSAMAQLVSGIAYDRQRRENKVRPMQT